MNDDFSSPELQKQNQNLNEIIEVAKQINSGLDINYIIKNVNMVMCSKFKPVITGFILQNDIDDFSPVFHMYKGIEFDKLELGFNSIAPLTQFFEKYEYNQITYDQFVKDLNKKSITEELKNFSPEFIIPLRSFKSILGIYLQGSRHDGKSYTMEDIQFCINILGFASISIENANLFREATVDRMTKLYTHHQFQEKLFREIKKGQRYVNKFSLIMFDIDHFKKFNDNYGHLQGDIIIKEIAKILVKFTRDIDMPARYGGEEFVVLMPEIGLDQAYQAAERLRKTIENYEFPGKNGPYDVTISAGVGEFDANQIKYNNDFIEFVDKALYQSKHDGRNRVTRAYF